MTFGSAPDFWWCAAPGWRSALLAPAALAYGWASARRLDGGERAEAGLPVLCIGNFTVGGGGKTPTALALGAAALRLGLKPGFLSRGHGGSARAPLLVDAERHDATMVGDEPLLLARLASTAVAVDRKQGAALLREAGCDLVIMDDGFQSARLGVDHAVLVVDAGRGLGNGRVIPAGPLRAPLATQLRHADSMILVGAGATGADVLRRGAEAGLPLFAARLAASPSARTLLTGKRVLAFAGIADPGKFHASLKAAGAVVVVTRDFPDHHLFSEAEVSALVREAAALGLLLATTRKDLVRLETGAPALQASARQIAVLDVDLVFEAADTGERLVLAAMEAFGRRSR